MIRVVFHWFFLHPVTQPVWTGRHEVVLSHDVTTHSSPLPPAISAGNPGSWNRLCIYSQTHAQVASTLINLWQPGLYVAPLSDSEPFPSPSAALLTSRAQCTTKHLLCHSWQQGKVGFSPVWSSSTWWLLSVLSLTGEQNDTEWAQKEWLQVRSRHRSAQSRQRRRKGAGKVAELGLQKEWKRF